MRWFKTVGFLMVVAVLAIGVLFMRWKHTTLQPVRAGEISVDLAELRRMTAEMAQTDREVTRMNLIFSAEAKRQSTKQD